MPPIVDEYGVDQPRSSSLSFYFRHLGMSDNLSEIPTAVSRWVLRIVSTASNYLTGIPNTVIVASLVINVLGLALPIVILQVYDRVLVNQSLETLFWLLSGLAIVVGAEAALKAMRSYLMFWSAAQDAFQNDASIVYRILHASSRRIKEDSAGIWLDRLESLDQINRFRASNSRLALLDVPFILIYLITIYLVAGTLVFAIIVVVSLLAAHAYNKARALREMLRARGELDRQRFSFLNETFQHIGAATSGAMEPQLERQFEQLQRAAVGTVFRKNLFTNELTATTNLVTSVVLVVVVTSGALMVISNDLSIGTLACATMLTSRLIQPVVRGIPVLLELQSTQLAEQRAQILQQLPFDATGGPSTEGIQSGDIQLTNVTYAYPGTSEPVIDIPKLTISHGEIIGIKGEQSSGKSTLLGLLRGELTPTSGTTYIAGQDLNCRDRAVILAGIRFVGPDPEVFQGTILENIIMHRRGDALLVGRHAAQLIGLEQHINRLPKGYDTPLGDVAAEVLPAGMLQQISIARALAGEPQVLLFDEANSRLDMRADAALRAGLQAVRGDGRMTCVLMSNRPSLLAIADRVFELHNGQLMQIHPVENSPAATAKMA